MSAVVVSFHTEHAVLEAFWLLVMAEQDRMELLKQVAATRIRRPRNWSPDDVRKAFVTGARPRGRASQCFTCYNHDRPRNWHHIVQLQHGGSNDSNNLVSLCELCHSRIHPWLAEPSPARLSGWTLVSELVQGTAVVSARTFEDLDVG